MDPDVTQSWEEFLNPNLMRTRLILASIYIACFEALKDSIVTGIRDFFCTGFDESGEKIDPQYESNVLVRNKSAAYASLDWLLEMGAIEEDDVRVYNRAKTCRNTLAHELFSKLASEGLPPYFEQAFVEMVALLRKIEVWWIVNVEIPTNPEFDGLEIDEEGIMPGRLIAIRALLDVALGDEKQSRFYYDELRKLTQDDLRSNFEHGTQKQICDE
jgi:hypothetical protein